MKGKILLSTLAFFSAASFADLTKICEFNDPITGTTAGCTETSVGGGYNSTYYWVEKDGTGLLTVEKQYGTWGGCTAKGHSNNGYFISGNCTNYRVHKD